jgi:hypothetical protein
VHGLLEDRPYAISVADLSGTGHPGVTYELRFGLDADLDLNPDTREIALGSSALTADTDLDDLDDYLELAEVGPSDPDADRRVAWLDRDADGDGLDDALEGAFDPDGDGTASFMDTDADGNGVHDRNEPRTDEGSPRNIDSDRVADFLDVDDDADGLVDLEDFATDLAPDWAGPYGLDLGLFGVTGKQSGVEFPGALIPGQTATIHGGPFGAAENLRVLIPVASNDAGRDFAAIQPLVVDASTLTVTVPIDAVAGDVRVLDRAARVRSLSLLTACLGPNAPLLGPLPVRTASPGGVIYLVGAHFQGGAPGTQLVLLDGVPIDVLTSSDDMIVAAVPSTARSGFLRVQTGGIDSNARFLCVQRALPGTIATSVDLGIPPTSLRVVGGALGGVAVVGSNRAFVAQANVNAFTLFVAAEAASGRPRLLGVARGDAAPLVLDERSTALALCFLAGTLALQEVEPIALLDALASSPALDGLAQDVEVALESDPSTLEDPPASLIAAIGQLLQDLVASSVAVPSTRSAPGCPTAEITPVQQDDFHLLSVPTDCFNLLADNDTRLYGSAQVTATESGEILRRHVDGFFSSHFLFPQGGLLGWPPLFNSTETLLHAPNGQDAQVEIITGGTAAGAGTPSDPHVHALCATATGLFQFAIPVLQTVLGATVGTSPDASQWIALLQLIDPPLFHRAVAEFATGELKQGLVTIFEIAGSDLARGPASEILKSLSVVDPTGLLARLVARKLALAVTLLSNSVDLAKTALDVGTTGSRLDFEVDFLLELESAAPERIVNYHFGNAEEDVQLVLRGIGFVAPSDTYGVEIGNELFPGAKASSGGTRLELRLRKADLKRLPVGEPPLRVVLNPGLPNEVRSNEVIVEVLYHPWIDVLDPSAGKAGDLIRVDGLGFHSIPPGDGNVAAFTGADGQLYPGAIHSAALDGRSLWVVVPPEAVTGPFHVTVPLAGGIVASNEVGFTTDLLITITYVDNGSAKDDIYALFFDDQFLHTTSGPSWPEQVVQLSTTYGPHRVNLVGIAAPDQIGTYGISFSSNVEVDPNSSDPLIGIDLIANAVKQFDIQVLSTLASAREGAAPWTRGIPCPGVERAHTRDRIR